MSIKTSVNVVIRTDCLIKSQKLPIAYKWPLRAYFILYEKYTFVTLEFICSYISLICFSDWAQAITKFLKEQLVKIMEHYQGSQTSATTSFLTAGPTAVVDIDSAMKYWNYVTQLAKHLYEVCSYCSY